MRKTSLTAGLLFVLVLNKGIVREQILVDPVLGIVRARNISVNVAGLRLFGYDAGLIVRNSYRPSAFVRIVPWILVPRLSPPLVE
jgi:hypothetical protein